MLARRLARLLALAALSVTPAGAAAQGVPCLQTLHDPDHAVNYLVFDHTGGRLYSVGSRKILVWDPTSGKLLRTLKFSESKYPTIAVPWGNTLAVALLEGSPGEVGKENRGKPVVNETWLWNPDDDAPTQLFGKDIVPIATSVDGKLLVTVNDKSTYQLWDRGNSKPISTLTITGRKNVLGPGTQAGTLIVTGEPSGRVRVYDLRTRKVVQMLTMPGPDPAAHAVAVSPDGRSVAVLVGNRQQLVGFDVKSGKQTFAEARETGSRMRVVFSPDGKVIAVGGQRVRLVATESGRELAKLDRQGSHTWVIAFSPDGKRLATGGADSSIKIWDLTGLKP